MRHKFVQHSGKEVYACLQFLSAEQKFAKKKAIK